MNFKFIDNAGISNKLKADLSDLVIRDEVSFCAMQKIIRREKQTD